MLKATLSITALFLLLTPSAFAVSADVFGAGQAHFGQNDDETLLVITGPAAEAMYNRLYVGVQPNGTGWLKQGRDYSCTLEAPVQLRRYSCQFNLEEVGTPKGSLLSGAILR